MIRKLVALISVLLLVFAPVYLFSSPTSVFAATTPSLGQAASFGILSSTYTNTVGGTTINGDLGYTTGPAVAPTVNGTTHIADGTYTQAGVDQGSALANLNSQACTHTFPAGAVNLSTDTSHGTAGIYTPGVYCTAASAAASIGTAGITLSGAGTYIFRIDGALTTVANSSVTLSNGASACDVFWTPAAATTLGANSTFAGTDIDDSGITIGSTVTWVYGRALAYGGTISTDTDTISVPTCGSTASTSSTTSSSTSPVLSNDTTSTPEIPSCPTISPQTVAPMVIESRRVDADSIFLSWGPYSGVNTFNIQYGITNGDWLYNTNVTGFSTTLNSLPSNQPIWVRIAPRNDCTIGSYGLAGQYGRVSLVGSPKLPNTGRASTQDNLPWYLLVGILTGISVMTVSKYRR